MTNEYQQQTRQPPWVINNKHEKLSVGVLRRNMIKLYKMKYPEWQNRIISIIA